MVTEAKFKAKVKARLNKLGPDCYYFVKEAAALRGIADIIGCYKGRFFAWELKRSESAAHSKRDGHELQLYHLELVKRANGIARVVYPENFDDCWAQLTNTRIERCSECGEPPWTHRPEANL